MDIKDRIKRLGRYFKEMQITSIDGQQVIYVVVSFPRGWIIDEDILDKYGVTVNEGTEIGNFYFCADIDTGENAIFDAIEYNISKMQDAIERAELLKSKTLELKKIFEDEGVTLDELRTLQFLYKDENPKENFLSKEEVPSMVITQSKKNKKSNELLSTVDRENKQEEIVEENE